MHPLLLQEIVVAIKVHMLLSIIKLACELSLKSWFRGGWHRAMHHPLTFFVTESDSQGRVRSSSLQEGRECVVQGRQSTSRLKKTRDGTVVRPVAEAQVVFYCFKKGELPGPRICRLIPSCHKFRDLKITPIVFSPNPNPNPYPTLTWPLW